jgi:hypothetical protein
MSGTRQQQIEADNQAVEADYATCATEPCVHIAGVTGSSPVSPTKSFQLLETPANAESAVTYGYSRTKPLELLPLLARKGTAERFWSRVKIGKPDECWPWLGSRKHSGMPYGKFKLASYKTVTASRCAYALGTGQEPGEAAVLHSCDNPPCCNPGHLYAGTIKDNSRDMVERGRWRTGHKVIRRLKPGEVEEIRELFAAGQTNTAIGKRYGVSRSTIANIRNGVSWT